VVEGRLDHAGLMHADTLLAKHDEKYMPREVVEALKKSGRWQEGAAK
jgi:cytochrome c-type biogenesis protein CcmE